MSQLIAAISTPPGPGGVGILRLSGPGAIGAASQAFRPRGKVPLAQAPDRQLLYGAVLDRDGRTIDTGLAFVSRAPHSYTGEETAELQCHGSPMVLSLALEALYAAGARPARPGEFTQRAFLNGKLDLTQAEAVIDLIDAESPSAARQAAGQLTGALSRRIEGIYSALTDTMAHFCAVLDYPDEDLDPFQTEALGRDLQAQASALQALLATGRRGQMLAQGITCALIGRPNAGKSSLLNALAGYERAIVTDIPGTTRDTVEESVLCGGVLLRLIDTAGIRATEDPVEQLGVERSRRAIASAELVLAVVDGAVPEDSEEGSLLADVARCGVPWLLVFTKRDMAGGLRTAGAVFPAGEGPLAPPAAVVSLSSVTGEGLEDLGNAVAALFPAGDPGEAGSLLTDRRQEDAARRALDAVRRALEALETGMTPDAVLTDAEEALDALGELTGRTAKEEIVSRIFSRFCVGK